MKFEHTLHTDGNGLWSASAQPVNVTSIETHYDEEEKNPDFGELQVFFDTASWDTEEDGLIYTDDNFEAELRTALQKAGFSEAAAKDVNYSEQGMQGDDYVSFDVGSDFLKEWLVLSSE